jgi:nucleotide-binding universal stress UspA family protein
VGALRHDRDAHPAALVVLATHQRAGMARWLHRAVAEPVARSAGAMTLFLPEAVAGLIGLDTGTVALRRVLIPIDQVPRPQAAVDAAAGLARSLGCPEVALTLVHVGATGHMPAVHEPRHAGWTWDRTGRRGEVVAQMLDVGTAGAADLIVLTTQGHVGFLDALRGRTSERLLRGTRCSILAVPAP